MLSKINVKLTYVHGVLKVENVLYKKKRRLRQLNPKSPIKSEKSELLSNDLLIANLRECSRKLSWASSFIISAKDDKQAENKIYRQTDRLAASQPANQTDWHSLQPNNSSVFWKIVFTKLTSFYYYTFCISKSYFLS